MDIIIRGGPFMWPILLESILALWVIIERVIFTFIILPRRRKALLELIENAEITDNDKIPETGDSIQNIKRSIRKAHEEGSLNVSLLSLHAERLIGEAERRLSILHIVAQSAPLLGLLGTVTGMIRAFIRIEALGGQVNPSDLAGGIWEALITTATGLIVAIPALIAYIAFSRVAEKFASEVSAAVSQIAHKLSRSGLEVV